MEFMARKIVTSENSKYLESFIILQGS